MTWDLYAQVPLGYKHPLLDFLVPVALTPVKKGFVMWNLDVLTSQQETGYSSCGALETYYSDEPEFDEKENCWVINADDADRIRKFCLPDAKIREWYAGLKKQPDIAELQKQANMMDGGTSDNEE